MDSKNIISKMENNMKEKLKYIPSKLDMYVGNINGVAIVDSGLLSDTFNTAFGGKINEDVAEMVFEYYKKNNKPMAWWIGPSSTSENAFRCLKKVGFVHDETDIGMACSSSQVVDDYEASDKLIIKKCTSPKELADFGEVLASIFNPRDSAVDMFYNKVATLNYKSFKDMIFFVGYEGSEAVATSCLFITDVAGIYDISTRPNKRKKGYGSKMFYHALMEAKKLGLKEFTLQASSDGLNIYKRFGFEEVCEFNVWSNQSTFK